MFHHDLAHTGVSPYDTSTNPGKQKWQFSFGGIGFDSDSPAVGPDGTIYVGAAYFFRAINPDGTQKWAFSWVGESSPAIGTNGTIYVGSDGGDLYAINPDGSQKWAFFMAFWGQQWSSPAIGPDGTIYIGSVGKDYDVGSLYAINPDGTQKWQFDTGGSESSPAIGADGTIYVLGGDGDPTLDNYLYAVNPDGSQKWAFDTGIWASYNLNGSGSPAISPDGTIYVGSEDGSFYAINPDGTQKWAFAAGGPVFSSAAIGADGTIYVGSDDGNVYAINPDGTQKWAFATRGLVDCSPAIGADGTIYVGSEDGNLYALGAAPSPTATATATATATPVAVTLKLAPKALKFPKTKLGESSKPKTVKVSNPKGNKKHPGLPVLIELISGDPVFAEVNDCPPTLAAGAVCSIAVTFTPDAAIAWRGTLAITDNAKDNPQTVPLSGTGK